MNRIYLAFLILGLFAFSPLISQDIKSGKKEPVKKVETKEKAKKREASSTDSKPIKIDKLSVKEAVQRSLEVNPTIQNLKYEIIKSDSAYLKNESKYAWRVIGDVDLQKSVLPFNRANYLSGTKSQTDIFSGGVDKLFATTGTYFKLTASHQRFDSNAFENPLQTPPGFGALGVQQLYTGAITALLSQDLLKNFFGIQMRNQEKILKNQAIIIREEMSYNIAGTVVQTLVDYWTYLVSDSSVDTFEKLSKNTRHIRNLTIQKTKLGLAERFEINQWNAVLSQSENQLENSKLEKEKNRKKLIRVLNLTEDSEIGGIEELTEDLPPGLDVEKDLDYAFQNRSDWKKIKLQKESSDLGIQIAENEALPSLKVTGSYALKGQNFNSPQKNFTDGSAGIPSARFFEAIGSAKLVYPIMDQGIKAGIRDAHIQKRQVNIQEEDLRREITDDVITRHNAVISSHKVLKSSVKMRKEAESYYNGLLASFRKGRFTAVAVKNALDTLVQYQLQEMQAKINFNINLMRYELAKNSLFKKFDVDLDKLLPVVQ
ncbi:MAG: TolC family protein [Leptospiraceae bacterium]|nr:TolC family protein [Leptospiraceae bacterium]